MARGVITSTGGKLSRSTRNPLSTTLIEDSPIPKGTPPAMDDLVPHVKGDPIEGMPNDWGTGKITAPKGSAGIIRPTTKPKKG